MKKKIFLYVLLVGIFSALTVKVLAAAPVPLAKSVTPTPTVTEVNYPLPYPGILPDNPLYPVKQFRDWILERLVMDPVRKIELNVLQGDKRIQMGILLIGKGKAQLGESTISKGEKYMVLAVNGATVLKDSGTAVPGYVIEKLQNALAKHEEVLNGLIAKAGDTEKAGLTESLALVKKLEADVEKLK